MPNATLFYSNFLSLLKATEYEGFGVDVAEQ